MRPDIRSYELWGFYSLHLRGLSDSKFSLQPKTYYQVVVAGSL
jgi:hypothetical protein